MTKSVVIRGYPGAVKTLFMLYITLYGISKRCIQMAQQGCAIIHSSSSSSYQTAFVSRWHAHSSAVVFYTLHIGQRDIILCPLIIYRLLLYTRYACSVPRVLLYFPSFTILPHSLPPLPLPLPAPPPYQYPPVITTASLIAPPGALSNPSHRYNSDCVAMYCATMFGCRLMYSSIIKNPASSRAVAAEVYVHLPYGVLRGRRPVRCLATWDWNLPRALPMRGVNTQVSDMKSSTACTMALKKKPGNHGVNPSTSDRSRSEV